MVRKTVVLCSLRSRRTRSHRWLRLCGSRPVLGSSRKSSGGRWTRPERDVEPAPLAAGQRAGRPRRDRPQVEVVVEGFGAALRFGVRQRRAARPAGSALRRPGTTDRCRRPATRSRSARARPAGRCSRSQPTTVAAPAVGCSSVVSIRSVVVLPAPFGPRKPTISPGSTTTSTPRTASTGPASW